MKVKPSEEMVDEDTLVFTYRFFWKNMMLTNLHGIEALLTLNTSGALALLISKYLYHRD